MLLFINNVSRIKHTNSPVFRTYQNQKHVLLIRSDICTKHWDKARSECIRFFKYCSECTKIDSWVCKYLQTFTKIINTPICQMELATQNNIGHVQHRSCMSTACKHSHYKVLKLMITMQVHGYTHHLASCTTVLIISMASALI